MNIVSFGQDGDFSEFHEGENEAAPKPVLTSVVDRAKNTNSAQSCRHDSGGGGTIVGNSNNIAAVESTSLHLHASLPNTLLFIGPNYDLNNFPSSNGDLNC